MKNLVLIGFMGSGKSTVGRMAAAELGMPFVDVDQKIEERQGCSISKIFSQKGESFFRELEAAWVEHLAAQNGQVIAVGGGAVLRSSNIEKLGCNSVLICLHVDTETVVARTRGHYHRPLLLQGDAPARIRELLKERQPLYDAIPNGVETSGRSLQEVAHDVVRIYHQSPM